MVGPDSWKTILKKPLLLKICFIEFGVKAFLCVKSPYLILPKKGEFAFGVWIIIKPPFFKTLLDCDISKLQLDINFLKNQNVSTGNEFSLIVMLKYEH